ncbi:MAG: hypothetical protein ACTSYO_08685 [Candidatus Ranarchaeia archaeon]
MLKHDMHNKNIRTLTNDIVKYLNNTLSPGLTQAITDLVLTTPYGFSLPVPAGKKILEFVSQSKELPHNSVREYIEALIYADAVGLWLTVYPYTKKDENGRSLLKQLAKIIPEEHRATYRYMKIRRYLETLR